MRLFFGQGTSTIYRIKTPVAFDCTYIRRQEEVYFTRTWRFAHRPHWPWKGKRSETLKVMLLQCMEIIKIFWRYIIKEPSILKTHLHVHRYLSFLWQDFQILLDWLWVFRRLLATVLLINELHVPQELPTWANGSFDVCYWQYFLSGINLVLVWSFILYIIDFRGHDSRSNVCDPF